MKRLFILSTSFVLVHKVYAQQINRINQIGISFPVIWNNSKILNVYSGARAKYISGSAVSYGANLDYSKSIYKNLFLIGGIGYYVQNFGIRRPFDFNGDLQTNLLYYTKRYSYYCLNLFIGAGRSYALNKICNLNASVAFHCLNTFKQEYVPTSTSYAYKKSQVEKRFYCFGWQIPISIDAYRNISKRLITGVGLIVPVYTTWRKDRIFRENENDFNHSRFSAGLSFSLKYNLNQN